MVPNHGHTIAAMLPARSRDFSTARFSQYCIDVHWLRHAAIGLFDSDLDFAPQFGQSLVSGPVTIHEQAERFSKQLGGRGEVSGRELLSDQIFEITRKGQVH